MQALHILPVEELVCQRRVEPPHPGPSVRPQCARCSDGLAAPSERAVGCRVADSRVLDPRAGMADRVQVRDGMGIHAAGLVTGSPFVTLAYAPSLATNVWRRYFTVPFLMLVLHMEPPSGMGMGMTAVAWAAVDAAASYMFLWRPFSWPDGTVARFMW